MKNPYFSILLLIVFICCLVVLFILSPILFYGLPYVSPAYLGQFSSLFTNNELSHLQDVTYIFTIVSLVEIAALLGFGSILILFSYLKFNKKIAVGFLWGSLLSLLLILLVIIAVFVDFQSLFLSFHYIFFPQGNWAFDQSSMLIQLFPTSFFKYITIQSFLTSIVLSVGVLFFVRKRLI